MKHRVRKFTQGGNEGLEDFEDKALPKAKIRDLEDFEDKAMPKRYSALEELSSGREKGSFDEDVYERARKFVNRSESGSSSAPRQKPSAKPAPAPSPEPAPAPAAKADIPKSAASAAPESTGEDTSGPSNLDRILLGLPAAGVGVAGLAKLRQMQNAKKAAETAKAAAAKFASPQARQTTSETGRRFGAKEEMEAAESTLRGAVGRKEIRAKRAATAKGRAEAMESNKPVMQATPKKPSPRSRTRDEETDYELRARGGRVGYAKGGQVRGGGCEVRGKTKGRFV